MLQWTRLSDTFSGSLSAQWTRRNSSFDPVTSGGMITTGTTAGFYPAEFTARPTRGPDQYVAVTIAQLHPSTGSGNTPSCLLLRSPNSATSGTVPILFIKNAQMGIYTMTSWTASGLTNRAAYANSNGGANMALGGRVEFWVVNNVYGCAYNGALISSWNDSSAIASQNTRYGGVAMQYGTDSGTSVSGVMGFSNFTFGEYRPVDVAMPGQGINRSGSF